MPLANSLIILILSAIVLVYDNAHGHGCAEVQAPELCNTQKQSSVQHQNRSVFAVAGNEDNGHKMLDSIE